MIVDNNNDMKISSNDKKLDENNNTDDKVGGCIIKEGDTPLIIASVACYASFIVYGASAGLLLLLSLSLSLYPLLLLRFTWFSITRNVSNF